MSPARVVTHNAHTSTEAQIVFRIFLSFMESEAGLTDILHCSGDGLYVAAGKMADTRERLASHEFSR
jgi:glucokinase